MCPFMIRRNELSQSLSNYSRIYESLVIVVCNVVETIEK